MMIVFISGLLIVQERQQDTLPYKAKCLPKLLVCGGECLSWLLTLQKLPMVLHQVMLSLPTVGRPLNSMSRTIVPVSSVYSFLYSGLAPKSSVSLYLSKTLCTALFFRSIGESLSGSGEIGRAHV